MNHLSSPRRDLNRRGGFTLLEVVIALAIFVFGALAIVRIFPPALGIIQNSGDQLVAVNLNRTTLARLARTPEIIPDAIYDTTAEGAVANWRGGAVGSVAGSGRRNNSLPVQNIQDYDLSALGHFKNITGERHTVPSDGSVLTQFPIDGDVGVYEEDSLTGVLLKGDGSLDISNAHPASSPTTAYTFPSTDRVYITYQWVENGRIFSTTDEPFDDPAGTVVHSGRAGFSATPTGTLYLVTGEVKARFRRLSTTITPVAPNGDLGYLDLTAFANKKVLLDYKVKDWRWLVQDGVPVFLPEAGASTERVVNLAVRRLDNTLGSPSAFTLLKNKSPLAPMAQTNDSGTLGSKLNEKTGQVIFDTSTYNAPTTRVVYRTLDNWTQQLSVAPPNYKLYYGRTGVIEPWRDCVYVNDNYIYFKPSEAGKTVMVSYSYENPAITPATNRNASNDIQINSRILTIDNDIIGAPTTIPAPIITTFGGKVSRLALTDVNSNLLGTPLTSIKSIQGISVQARTAWLNGDRFTQTLATNYRGASNP